MRDTAYGALPSPPTRGSMSRHDPYQPPWLRPQAVRLWKKYREEHEHDWEHRREKIRDGVTAPDGEFRRHEYMPESLFFDSRWFKNFRDRPEPLAWKDERTDTPHGYQDVPTARWTEGPLAVVVRQIPYNLDDWSTYGMFTDKPDAPLSTGQTWGTMFFVDSILKKGLFRTLAEKEGLWSHTTDPKALEGAWSALRSELRRRIGPGSPKNNHLRLLRGPDSRHAWRVGVYDTFQGNDDHPDRYRKLRYIQLADYNYDELREWYWLMGRSKREADELARQEFRSRVAFMKRIAEGQVYDTFVEAKVYRADDEDEDDELGCAGTSTLVDLDYRSEQRWLDATAREVANEAIHEARKHFESDPNTGYLPGVQ